MIERSKALILLFTEHPHNYGKNYFTHMLSAIGFSLILVKAGVFCFIHALFPFIFKKAASNAAAKILATTEARERWT